MEPVGSKDLRELEKQGLGGVRMLENNPFSTLCGNHCTKTRVSEPVCETPLAPFARVRELQLVSPLHSTLTPFCRPKQPPGLRGARRSLLPPLGAAGSWSQLCGLE